MLIKQKSPSFLRNLALGTFGKLPVKKSKSAIPPLFNSPEVLSSAPDKTKLFAEHFSNDSNLDYPGISLPIFPSRSNLKQSETV